MQAAQQQGRPIAVLAVAALQVVERGQHGTDADGVGPGQRALGIVDPGAHCQVDVGGRADALQHGVGGLVGEHGDGAQYHQRRAVAHFGHGDAGGLQHAYDLNIMRPGQDLFDITCNVLQGLKPVLEKERPDVVLVHGDTTTTMAASIASFYCRTRVGHVEAGLRTHDKFAPFQGGRGERSLSQTNFLSVEHSIGCWIKVNGCQAKPVVVELPTEIEDGTKVTRKTWGGGRNGAEVVLIEIAGAGHTWPGRRPPLLYLGKSTKNISANEVRAILSGVPGVIVYDDPKKNLYPLAIDVAGKDEIYVGRIRVDESIPNGINMWIVSDNLRKGAALNAVQIAELIIQ